MENLSRQYRESGGEQLPYWLQCWPTYALPISTIVRFYTVE
jgi:hypothetical protein